MRDKRPHSFVLLLVGIFTWSAGLGSVVQQDLYINSGVMNTSSGAIPALAFNSSPTFHSTNVVLSVSVNDTLSLTLFNTDNVAHSFALRGTAYSVGPIQPGSNATIEISGVDEGLYIYQDPTEMHTYMGLAGMLSIVSGSYSSFYWNIHEYQKSWSDSIASGLMPTANFQPDHFTINGLDHPASQSDPLAVIEGNVGDTLIVFIANTGLMAHAIHSHGFHGEILGSSKYPAHVSRVKDSFPVLPLETLIIRFVPHQPGLYPIHDHNLVAVTSGGNYPGGMISKFDIQP